MTGSHGSLVAGIDEAGRGSLLGPLVVAGVAVNDPGILVRIGCRDSKLLKPARREKVDRDLRNHPAVHIELRVIKPEVLDSERQLRRFNDIVIQRVCDVAVDLNPTLLYVDSVGDPLECLNALSQRLPPSIKAVAEYHADGEYPVVGAASIVAKVARDAEIAKLARHLEPRLGIRLGPGYGGGDGTTNRFLEQWLERFGDLPEGMRRSCKTARKLLPHASGAKCRSCGNVWASAAGYAMPKNCPICGATGSV